MTAVSVSFSLSRLGEEAERLAALPELPEQPPDDRLWLAQSLSQGTAGTALLHAERALTGLGSWQRAHAWIRAAVRGEVSASAATGLCLGLPAVAFMLDAASADGRYQAALADVDGHLAQLTHTRADAASARIRAGRLTGFAEYDVFFGLTGLGAVLLRRAPGGSAMEHVLGCLVALTRPLRVDRDELPGWWAWHDPSRRPSPGFAGGHGNFGAAHGIAGPLALLGHAARRGAVVDGHLEAVRTILAWLDEWRQDSDAGPWWPEWITRDHLKNRQPGQREPNRPSWCYGTPGIARAGQVACIAIGDQARRHRYEDALARCAGDHAQLTRISDAGLCHGAAGLYMTAWRAARDAAGPAIGERLPGLAALLHRRAVAAVPAAPGFLDASAGTALALHAAAAGAAPESGWDACLLIS